jgi:hypothetical protein
MAPALLALPPGVAGERLAWLACLLHAPSAAAVVPLALANPALLLVEHDSLARALDSLLAAACRSAISQGVDASIVRAAVLSSLRTDPSLLLAGPAVLAHGLSGLQDLLQCSELDAALLAARAVAGAVAPQALPAGLSLPKRPGHARKRPDLCLSPVRLQRPQQWLLRGKAAANTRALLGALGVRQSLAAELLCARPALLSLPPAALRVACTSLRAALGYSTRWRDEAERMRPAALAALLTLGEHRFQRLIWLQRAWLNGGIGLREALTLSPEEFAEQFPGFQAAPRRFWWRGGSGSGRGAQARLFVD